MSRYVTVRLTEPQARALFGAAGRGIDEWDAEGDDQGSDRRDARTAMRGVHALVDAYEQQVGRSIAEDA